MKYSVQHMNNDVYKITITSSTDYEKKVLEGPISEAKKIVYEHFHQAIVEKLGENAEISGYVDESNLPNEIQALISFKKS